MIVTTPACIVCGKPSEVSLTDEEFNRLQSGLLIQEALPDWTPGQREVLQTGIHPECWDRMMEGFDDE